MSNIEDLRNEINQIDEKIIKLFEERMNISVKVGEYKKLNNLPILDQQREDELIEKNLAHLNNKNLKNYYIEFQKKVMELSKKLQEEVING